jgi:hypothetical protein
MYSSQELNALWREDKISPEQMKEELLEHTTLRQYEVERLAVITGRNARATIRDLQPIKDNQRKYVYFADDVKKYLEL